MAPSKSGSPFRFDYVRPPDRVSTFDGILLHSDDRMLVLSQQLSPSRPLKVNGETVMDAGYEAVWFLFKGLAWDVGRVSRRDRKVTGYYVDALIPVHWHGHDAKSLEPLTDLFLDLWVGCDGTVQMLDEDELIVAEQRGWVTRTQAELARQTLTELAAHARTRTFPPSEVTQWPR